MLAVIGTPSRQSLTAAIMLAIQAHYIDHVGMSPYLRRIRQRIGTDLLLLPAVSVLVWDDDGRLLLVRGADSGTWQVIGGGVEPDESPSDAARREAIEEIGVEVSLTAIRAVIGGPRFHHTYPNGDRVAFVSTVFDARIVGGEPVPDDDETTEVAWFARAELAAGARDAPGSARDERLPRLALAILEAAGITAA
jgi:8-oxo-dGTP pyrophosphatase MutT (NUDIX family)